MTSKKAPNENVKPAGGIQINRSRGGGKKKPDLFANLRNTEHPLDNIVPQSESLGAQNTNTLDAQTFNNVTSKLKNSGRPNTITLGAQSPKTVTPKMEISGRPKEQTLDVKAPKKQVWAPKEDENLGVKTPKEKSLGAQKSVKPEGWQKYEGKRSTSRLALRPNEEILRKFKIYCAEKGLGMTEFFEIAGLRFIDLDAQSEESLGVLTPIDDRRMMMMFKSRPFIINLYLKYNSIFNEISGEKKGKWTGRWTPRDDEAARRYNEIDPKIVELGIIQTQTNKGFGQGKIQTFKYYTEEIEKVLNSGVSDEMLETILQYHRKIWKNRTNVEIDLSFLSNDE